MADVYLLNSSPENPLIPIFPSLSIPLPAIASSFQLLYCLFCLRVSASDSPILAIATPNVKSFTFHTAFWSLRLMRYKYLCVHYIRHIWNEVVFGSWHSAAIMNQALRRDKLRPPQKGQTPAEVGQRLHEWWSRERIFSHFWQFSMCMQ